MLTLIEQEGSPVIELESGNKTRAIAFSANGEYLVSGDERKVRVWRALNGKQVATMAAELVNCVAMSRDGRWIAAGTFTGEVIVWDAQKAYRKLFAHDIQGYVARLDVSPDSSRLLTASFNCKATIFEVPKREQLLTIRHDDEIIAAKYSHRGHRIAIATAKRIRIYNSDDIRIFVDIKAEVTPWYNTGLLCVLIDTDTGRLFDKSKQASWFESLPVFKELISSMTVQIDLARIEQEVAKYYSYAALSHTWEDDEPSFEKVSRIMVYDLEASTTHDKLQMFCKIVWDAGFHWAWSDTCCINKADHVVLQEALVSMFKWYEGSVLTIIFLRGVRSPSRRGDLVGSLWNTRAWTFQEYHASRVVRFYNEDWTPYLNLDISNHKESPEIMLEMEEATGISAHVLMALRPGINDIREKLCLASERETTFVEGAAYSLLGIFTLSLPVVYGEGDEAFGRLLAQLLTISGDTSILAWTGKSGSFNSCLPSDITVFKQSPSLHVPLAIEPSEMETIIARIRSPSSLAMKLYDRLQELPVPSFSDKRMRLPCLVFRLGPISATSSASGHMFRARTDALGIVEITTNEDLSQLDSLILVHPWIDFLLDRQLIGGLTDMIDPRSSLMSSSVSSSSASYTGSIAHQRRPAHFIGRLRRSISGQYQDTPSLPSPAPVSHADRRTHALQLVARLRQPFGALLFKPVRQHGGNTSGSLRRARSPSRIQEETPLETLMENVRTLDVL